MKFCKVVNEVVTQTQPYAGNGFEPCDDSVVCGQVKSGEGFVNPTPTEEEVVAKKLKLYETNIEARLDEEAQSRTYDNINSIAKFQGYDNHFRAECEALGAWAAATWTKSHEVLAAWQAGGDEPTWEEIEAQLPAAPVL